MNRYCPTLLILLVTVLRVVPGLAEEVTRFTPDLAVHYRPHAGGDEAGLWMQVENFEKELAQSPSVIRDEALNDYVKEIVCKLAGEYCSDFRVYIIRNPYFNATMWPNGMMNVWTGLLLRTKNEAQLSAVLGHEIAHYLRAHSIDRWRRIRSSTSFTAFLNLGLAAGGAGNVGNLTNLALLAGLSAYGRDHEREADRYGMQLMAQAGYDPMEAAAVWEYLLQEDAKALNKHKGNIFTATHPSEQERATGLAQYANTLYPDRTVYKVNTDQYSKQLAPLFTILMEDQLRLHDHGRTEVLLDSFNGTVIPKGELYYFKGEFFRLRKQEGDIELAMAAYKESIGQPDVPADAYRQLAYLYLKEKNLEKVHEYFTAYLRFEPDAPDRAMIEYYLKPAAGE